MENASAITQLNQSTQESMNVLNAQMQSNRQITNSGIAAQASRMSDQMNSDAMAGQVSLARSIGQGIKGQ
jgi:hypothetical protein